MKIHKFKIRSRRIKNILILLISLFIILSGIGIIWLSSLKIPDLDAFEGRKIVQSTKIYDRTGKILLYDVHQDAKRSVVSLEDISPFVQKATIAIEDDNFYNHGGIQIKAIIRALIADVSTRDFSQGGSTITQQVIKNSLLTQDKTITRKLKELVLAIKLENVLSKDQILAAYLNETAYGGNLYGVEEATQAFYAKPAKEVTLAEAAYIAALAQAPTYYSPYGKNRVELDKRKNLVLKRMLENKFITQAEYDRAIQEKVQFKDKKETGIKAPHFVIFVRDYLIDKYGEDTVEQGGLRVVTTLDYNLQQKAENTTKNFSPVILENFGATNMGMVAIDPKTGDILSMIGSKDYFDKTIDGNFNIVTTHRQPGSALKPFVYATAFKEGYTPETILFDVKTEFNANCNPDSTPRTPSAKCYSPAEWDLQFPGPMQMKYALAQSRNVPGVKTLYLSGISDSIKTMEDMGITSLTDPDRYGLTLVLGGGEVSLLELTSAYSVFANDGVRNPYRAVLRVEDSKGNVLEEAQAHPTRVLEENVARQVSDSLSDPAVRVLSIKNIIANIGHDVAVKTGTTNDYRDVWTLGYTPQLAVGMWAGNNDNKPINKEKTAGPVITPVWASFMTDALKELPNESFPKPDPTPTNLKPVLRGYWQGGQTYIIDSSTGNLATEQTPLELRKEVPISNVHDILYWVDKSDPRGPIPTNPGRDPQFENWEYGVQQWLRSYSINHPEVLMTTTMVPTIQTAPRTSTIAPKVTISTPRVDSTYNNRDIVFVSLNIIPGGSQVTKAEFFVNEKYIGTSQSAPFSFSFVPADFAAAINDVNALKVVVYDSVNTKGEALTNFRVIR